MCNVSVLSIVCHPLQYFQVCVDSEMTVNSTDKRSSIAVSFGLEHH